MGDHRVNPTAIANAVPQRRVETLDIGEGYRVAGVTIEPVLSFGSADEESNLAIILTVVGGRHSDLVPTVPVKLLLGELASIPLSKLREKMQAAIDGPKEEAAQ